jgi:hypothetical protein
MTLERVAMQINDPRQHEKAAQVDLRLARRTGKTALRNAHLARLDPPVAQDLGTGQA